jgi:hypothetical protein
MPPAARLLGSVSQPYPFGPIGPPAGRSTEAVLDVAGPAAAVLDFYEESLSGTGWSHPPDPVEVRPGGFAMMPTPPGRIFCGSANGPVLRVTVSERTAAPSDVRLYLTVGVPGPCAGTPRGGMGHPLFDRIPPLQPPAGVLLEPLGGAGGDARASSNALARTDRSAADLEAHFSAQMAAAGWQRRGGGAGGALAWSRWTQSRAGEWRALLWVLEEPDPDLRYLHVRVETGAAGRGMQWSGSAEMIVTST